MVKLFCSIERVFNPDKLSSNMKKITLRIPKRKVRTALKLLKDNNIKNFIELSHKGRAKIEIITSDATAEKTAAMMKDGLGIGKSLEEGLIEISDTTVYSPYIQEKEADHLMEKVIDTKIKEFSRLDNHFVIFSILSSIIATIGILLGSELILIGSMLVSPLMLPMMSTSFSVVSRKTSTLKHALKTELAGIFIIFIVTAVTAFIIPGNGSLSSLIVRASYSHVYIPLAIVLGIVAAYSFATDKVRNLTGVAISVSLLPPLVVSVILTMVGQFSSAIQAMTVFVVNALGIHMSSIAVFMYLKAKAPEWYKFRGL